MVAKLIDGKARSALCKQRTADAVAQFIKQTSTTPALAVVLAGDDEASKVYVKNKVAACALCGIKSHSYTFDAHVSQEQLFELIDALCADKNIHGILVQLPLPPHIDEEAVLARITPQKDVDGFSLLNSGKLLRGNHSALLPCTPAGCIDLIKSTGTDIFGKHAVVVGRSNIVGKPLALMLLAENATVTVCHSRTAKLKQHTLSADILCVAVGIPGFVTGDMVKSGATVIDVGINRSGGKLCGDVEFESAAKRAAFITPVPGGVGPMTIAMLMENTLKAAKLQCLR